MGCGNCGTAKGGKPSGCQSNGGCSTGGCNRMNVFDWLGEIPLTDIMAPFNIVEVSFSKGSRKDYFRNSSALPLEKGEMIAVEGVNGFDVGMVSLTGELVKLQMKKYSVKDNADIKRILRSATETDLEAYYLNKDREQEVMVRSRAIAKQINLDMKVAEVEIQADGKKATFFYTADGRVDFRELIRVYASEFRVKVEMKQIGARQESGKVGGIGSCGRELCCSTWLSDFKSVNTTAARYQNLSINQTKLSGQCGRLKCCLNYELDTYMDALRVFPTNAEQLELAQGIAYLSKRDIFKSLMWYGFKGSSKQYPVPIERVKEIVALNKEGIKPEELGAVELELKTKEDSQVDKGFVNDVGQITLRALEKGGGKKSRSSGNKQGKGKEKAEGGRPEQKQGIGGQSAKDGNKPDAQARQQRDERRHKQHQKKEGQQPQQRDGQQSQQAKPQQQPQAGVGGEQPAAGEGRNKRKRNRNNQPRQGQDGSTPPSTENN